MGDLLLRGIDDALKVELQESVRRNGRSLSEEAIAQIRSALEREQRQGPTAGQRLRAVLGDATFEDDELRAIDAFVSSLTGRHRTSHDRSRYECHFRTPGTAA